MNGHIYQPIIGPMYLRKNTLTTSFVCCELFLLVPLVPGLWCWMELWRMARGQSCRGGAHGGWVRRDGRLHLGVLGKDTTRRKGIPFEGNSVGKTFASNFLVSIGKMPRILFQNSYTSLLRVVFIIVEAPMKPWCFFRRICLDVLLRFGAVYLKCLVIIPFARWGVLFGGSCRLKMRHDMKVLYYPHPLSSRCFLPIFTSSFDRKFLCLQFADVGRHSQQRWNCHLAESLLHPFLLAFKHVCGFRWERVGHVFHGGGECWEHRGLFLAGGSRWWRKQRSPRSLEIK